MNMPESALLAAYSSWADRYYTFMRWLLALAVLLSALGNPAFAQTSESCTQFRLSAAPDWTASIAWSPNHRALIFADPTSATLHAFRPSYLSKSMILDPGLTQTLNENQPARRPSTLHRISSGFLLEDAADGSIVRLSSSWESVDRVRVAGMYHRTQGTLEALHNWRPSPDGSEIFAYGDVKAQDSSKWTAALVRIDLSEETFEVIQEQEFSSPLRSLYLAGLPYIEARGTPATFVGQNTNGEIRLVRHAAGTRTVQEPPGQLRRFLNFRDFVHYNGLANFVDFFDSLGSREYLAGFLEVDGVSHLLLRARTDAGRYVWAVADEQDGDRQQISFVQLPVQSPQVLITSTEDSVILVEATVTDVGRKEFGSVWEIPNNLLNSAVALAQEHPGRVRLVCQN